MKISDIRASLQRLAERLDNQWAYARSDAEMDIAAGRAEYNDDGERLPTEPEISYYGMIAALKSLAWAIGRQRLSPSRLTTSTSWRSSASRTTSRPASRNPCPARNFAAWSLGNVKI